MTGIGLTDPGILMIVNSGSRVEITPTSPQAPATAPENAHAVEIGASGAL